MKIVMYVLTVLFGAWGLAGFLRGLEVMVLQRNFSGSLGALCAGVLFLVLAFACLKKARSGGSTE